MNENAPLPAAQGAAETDGRSRLSVQVVHRSLRVLETLSAAIGPLSLSAVSQAVGLHRSTTLRILRTLADDGYTVFDPDKRTWVIGPAILRLQAGARAHGDLRHVALPIMQALCERVGETVQLATMLNHQVCYLEKVEPPEQQVKVLTEIGSRRPLYCTALGKALMSGLEPAELEPLVAAMELVPHTERTVTDRRALLDQVAEARRRGYALDLREYNRAVQCSAAPVRDATGSVVGALSISTIGLEADSAAFRAIIDRNVEAAQALSRALGWQPPAAGAADGA
ncbi:IclR family transcriptional regulator [Aquibium sp. A9E412]|uniref:IclR family transcriptional regulator n=1 Tax=Aquibium sp. A9E412 TaxID=2976767 RepID=UPI0025AF1C60|nr:IclR family transcriptional regulator [Aquibium sp. A9E412]MDN2564873.1 IclR family transcriptional regulator [Aquibium sp. A9E412]